MPVNTAAVLTRKNLVYCEEWYNCCLAMFLYYICDILMLRHPCSSRNWVMLCSIKKQGYFQSVGALFVQTMMFPHFPDNPIMLSPSFANCWFYEWNLKDVGRWLKSPTRFIAVCIRGCSNLPCRLNGPRWSSIADTLFSDVPTSRLFPGASRTITRWVWSLQLRWFIVFIIWAVFFKCDVCLPSSAYTFQRHDF